MPKADFQPLFESGIHKITLSKLAEITSGSPPTEKRRELMVGFAGFLRHAMSANLHSMEIWIDGSFMTVKDEPDDVDCVLWVPRSHVDQCSEADYDKLQTLLNRPFIRYKFGVDLYIGDPDAADELSTWEHTFGTAHDNVSTKGFVSLTI